MFSSKNVLCSYFQVFAHTVPSDGNIFPSSPTSPMLGNLPFFLPCQQDFTGNSWCPVPRGKSWSRACALSFAVFPNLQLEVATSRILGPMTPLGESFASWMTSFAWQLIWGVVQSPPSETLHYTWKMTSPPERREKLSKSLVPEAACHHTYVRKQAQIIYASYSLQLKTSDFEKVTSSRKHSLAAKNRIKGPLLEAVDASCLS